MKITEAKVLVGCVTAGYSRNDTFYDFFDVLKASLPAGWPCMTVRGQSPARGRNILIKTALQLDCTHVMFFDDDMAMERDIIARLLAHNKDIVTGLYLMRNFPHKPVAFAESFVDGRCLHYFPSENETGLVEIVNCGFGAVLINTDVFRTMGPELFGEHEIWVKLGETEPDHWGDDIGFFNRVRKFGYKLYCDLDVQVGHMATVTIRPKLQDGKWYVAYDTAGEGQAAFPAITPTPEYVETQRQKVLKGIEDVSKQSVCED